MVDFAKAFETGQIAAKRAEENKRSVDEVFKNLNKELAAATNGKILITRDKSRPIQTLSDLFSGNIEKGYIRIGACNPKASDNELKELAIWEQNKAGYPCTIELPGKRIHCEDKEGLEAGLEALLQDPKVGEILFKLTQLPETQSDATTVESNA